MKHKRKIIPITRNHIFLLLLNVQQQKNIRMHFIKSSEQMRTKKRQTQKRGVFSFMQFEGENCDE